MVNKLIFLSISIVFLSTGCASTPKQVPEPMQEVSRLPEYTPPKQEQGSLWSSAGGTELFPDSRARKVGDIITVRVVEDPEAALKANTSTSRSSSAAGTLKFLGYMDALAEKNPRLAQIPGEDELINAALTSQFTGTGGSDRDGHVKAYVTAVVTQVFPNGNLYIDGRREIRVNNETQFIAISGIIRPGDISPSNEIASTFVANARIVYAGSGAIADKQKPGWLGRVVDNVWPF